MLLITSLQELRGSLGVNTTWTTKVTFLTENFLVNFLADFGYGIQNTNFWMLLCEPDPRFVCLFTLFTPHQAPCQYSVDPERSCRMGATCRQYHHQYLQTSRRIGTRGTWFPRIWLCRRGGLDLTLAWVVSGTCEKARNMWR